MGNDKLVLKKKKYTGESSVVSIRLPMDMVENIDDIAKKTNRTRNELLILCLEFALNNLVIENEGEDD